MKFSFSPLYGFLGAIGLGVGGIFWIPLGIIGVVFALWCTLKGEYLLGLVALAVAIAGIFTGWALRAYLLLSTRW